MKADRSTIASGSAVSGWQRRSLGRELVDYRGLARTIWRRKFWIGGIGLAAAALVAYALQNVESSYTANSEVLLETRGAQVINIANVVDEALINDSAVLAQLAIIRSRPTLRRVVHELNLTGNPEFRPIGGASAPDGLPTPLQNPPDEAPSKPVVGDMEIEAAADILAEMLTVSQLGLSHILRISVVSPDPDLSAKIANGVAQVYIEQQVESKLAANRNATVWLSQRVEELRVRLEESETRYERSNEQMAAEGQLSSVTREQQKTGLSATVVRSRADLALAEARADQFAELIRDGHFAPAMQIASSETLERLVERRSNILQQRQGLLDETLSAIEDAIRVEAGELLAGLRAFVAIGADELRRLNGQLAKLDLASYDQSAEMVELRALEREIEAQRDIYQRFLTRLTETRERGDFQQADARVIQPAEAPPSPSAPNRSTLVLMALVFGVGAGAAGVLALEIRRDTFRTPDEVESQLGYPVLATFPEPEGDGRAGASEATEVKRSSRRLAMLAGLSPYGANRKLLVASVLPDDGSLQVARLVAEACYAEGNGVILADATANFQPADGADGAKQAKGYETVPFPMSRHANESAAGSRADRLQALANDHDIVVLHGPPLLASSDSLGLGKLADAVLLVFAWEATPKAAVEKALEDLVRLGTPVVGLVMTGVNPRVAACYEYRSYISVRKKCESYGLGR
jgi:succinoglycan biosynthesis transport protein ExoP